LKAAQWREKLRSDRQNIFWALAAFCSILISWQATVTFTLGGAALPGPSKVLNEFFKSFYTPIGQYTLLGHIGWSLYRVLVGFTAASLLGVVVGLAMGWSKLAKAIIGPVFEWLRPIPALAWIPLAILWFGIGETTKYFIIFVGTFTNVTLNAYAGARQVDPVLIGASRMLGAKKNQVFTRVVLPSSVPQIFAGLQLGFSTSWMSVLAAEMVRSSEGAGWIIIMGQNTGNTTQIIVGIIAIGLVGLCLATLMRGVERGLCSWNIRGT
jgi:NitT/TauT family transport system permease protein/sulfonate transport system permease protein